MTDAAFWDKAAPKYAKSPISDMAAYTVTLNRIKEILQPHHRVLELGCGTGSTALQLADGVNGYLATDVSSGMIRIAKEKQADTLPHLSFAVHAAGDLPDGSHDVILALNLLHLVDGMEDVVKRVYDALPSGGIFIAKTALLKDGAWFLPMAIPIMRAFGKAPFVRVLRGTEMIGILEDTGFDVTETLTQKGMAPRLFTVARKP